MSLTVTVKDELAFVATENAVQQQAEVSAVPRFARGLHIVSGRIIVEAELDHGGMVRCLHQHLKEFYGMELEVMVVQGGSLHRGFRYILRVTRRGKDLARLSGLVDDRGRSVRGIPVSIIQGGRNATAAAWCEAFLAHGSPTEPGRSSSLEVTCPDLKAALALVETARRFDTSTKTQKVHGVDRVVVCDGEAIGTLLERMRIPEVFKVWIERRSRRESRGATSRLANFGDANLCRSARVAVASGTRVEQAFEILGDDVPTHLLQAGRLRIAHKQASLEGLGQLSDPQLTKDVVAGRTRRLPAVADKQTHELGVLGTESVLTQEMFES